jgi:hypothetical protein
MKLLSESYISNTAAAEISQKSLSVALTYISQHIWTPPFCKLFLFASYGQSTQLLPYIRPVNEAFAASGPDGFPRALISIILPASKAHALNGFLKTPV